MTGQLVGTNLELYEIRGNDTTQERDNIFMWKDIWKKVEMSCDSPKAVDASMQSQTPSNVSYIGSISMGIVASSMSLQSGDSDGPMTASSRIDAVVPRFSVSQPKRNRSYAYCRMCPSPLVCTRNEPIGLVIKEQICPGFMILLIKNKLLMIYRIFC